MDIIESLKIIHKTLNDDHGFRLHWYSSKLFPSNGREWNKLARAIDHVAAELGYEFRADDTVVCVKPDREGV